MRALLALMTGLLGGCTINPPYAFAPGEGKAGLRVVEAGKVAMCKDSKFYSAPEADASGVAQIPAGGRLTIGSFMSYSGHNVTYTCYPFLSFSPREGQTYLVHSYVRESKCYIELVRQDLTRETGVAIEPSVGPRDCYIKKS